MSASPADALGDRIVIVGAGQAGARAAEALRGAGHRGKIHLVGDEVHAPYERPQLSKEILLDPSAVLTSIKQREGWASLGVELVTQSKVRDCSLEARTIAFETGDALAFDRLILATGVEPRTAPALDNPHIPVRTLRTIEDALFLRGQFKPGARIVLIGGGVIGLETAAAAAKAGCDVTVVEATATLLSRALPAEVGGFLQRRHERDDVAFRFGVVAERVEADGVILSDGALLPADCIIVGIGGAPRIALAQQIGLDCADGIRVDAYGRTDAPGVFAVGDVAAQWSAARGSWARVETWANAQNQAIAVARCMAGQDAPYRDPPWFWTDQYDVNVQVAGDLASSELCLRGDMESGRFAMIGLRDGVLCGAVTVNNRKDMAVLRKLATRRVNRADLENPSFDLRKALV